MYQHKYYTWLNECNIKLFEKKEQHKAALAAICINIIKVKNQNKRNYRKKRYWVEAMLKERNTYGFYHAIFPVITLEQSRFRNYFRMSSTQFENLLCLVAPFITKQTVIREPISAGERLSLTLRFLASGDSMSLSYQYLIGLTTVTNIIKETCNAIWVCLQKKVLPSSFTENEWLNIAYEFEQTWNFPHCIGAIDGKHILIQCPDNAGSSYFNYKNTHSIILLGICNANYMLIFVDIGGYDRRSDGGIFKDSIIGQKLTRKEMNLPEWKSLTIDGPPLPYVLIGDEAFPLTEYLLRPYPGKAGLTQNRTIYNYRLSRARRTIENTFGILVCQWRILKRPIICIVDKAMKIVQAIVCLHNWIRHQDLEENQYVTPTIVDQDGPDEFLPGSWRQEINNSALKDITRCSTNNSSQQATKICEEFCTFFNNEGAVPWQFANC